MTGENLSRFLGFAGRDMANYLMFLRDKIQLFRLARKIQKH